MTREETLARYWKAYQDASLINYGCDVGELQDLDHNEQDSISDALETVISVDVLERVELWARSPDVYHRHMLDGVKKILKKEAA